VAAARASDLQQRVHPLVRPLAEPQARPAAQQSEDPRFGVWTGRGERGHVPELREDHVAEGQGLIAHRNRIEVGQIRVQDDE
jgi:hypothetical protein